MPSRINRRGFLAGSASVVAVLGALQARRSAAASRESRFVPGPYGPLRPVKDLETGLPLIHLPEGFEYRTYSWTGDAMSDGALTPGAHDGMGVVASRMVDGEREITLVRNHERWLASPILAPARYDTAATDPAFAPRLSRSAAAAG
jgi:secreted PhoX family phosphatase